MQMNSIEKIEVITGMKFRKSNNSDSYYGQYDGIVVRLSDHPSKFNERADQIGIASVDLNYNVLTPEYIASVIKNENPFNGMESGAIINHFRLGSMTFIDYTHSEKKVTVLTQDGITKNYHEDVFFRL
jgi:hypothetical protein